MSLKPKLLLSWSSGKDSAWALHSLRQAGAFDIAGLVTTVNEEYNRVAMHGVRAELLERQAAATGLPVWRVSLPHPCPNEEYERRMQALIARAREAGVTHMAFGDLFLEDIRVYRERQLRGTGITPVFPLWQLDTHRLARDMIAAGLRAVLTCVDPKRLSPDFAGARFDLDLLARLPRDIDPCGENGEFHTFCYAGPMFARNLRIDIGDRAMRDGYAFCDLLPADQTCDA